MAKRGPKARTATNSRRKPRAEAGGLWSGLGGVPDGLSPGAEAEYVRLVKALRSLGLLDKTDPRLVELYAVQYDLLTRAREQIDLDGVTVAGPRGGILPHPMIPVVNAATIRLKAIINDLGLAPASSRHAAAGAPESEQSSPWDGLLKVNAG